MFQQIWAVVRKDLTLELRSKEGLLAMLVFGLIVLVVLNFAFESMRQEARRSASGILWVAFTFAGVLGLNRSFAVERENRALEAVRLAPIDSGSLYLGKWLSSTVFMLIAEAFLLPVFVVLFDVRVDANLAKLLGFALLGTSGFCAIGALLSAVAANTRMREVLLPILLFPLAVPLLIAAVEGSTALLAQGEPETIRQALRILIGCNVIYVVLSYLVFEYVLEQ